MGVVESTGKVVEPFPPWCRLIKVQIGDERYPAWVIFFVDNAISVDIQRGKDRARCCRALTASLEDALFQVMGDRAEGKDLYCRQPR